MDTVYTAEALATGAGRNGRTRTTDGRIDLGLAVPQEMGGSGDGANPEQLFAAGYAACFHSALQMVARQEKVKLGDSSVGASVGIGGNGRAASASRWTWRSCFRTWTRPPPSPWPTRPTRCARTRTPPAAMSTSA